MSDLNEIAKRLKMLRIEKGLTQEQLAEAVEISQKSVSLYERAANNMSINTAKKIADFLDVSYLYLLGESSKKYNDPVGFKDVFRVEDFFKKTIPVYAAAGAGGSKIAEQEIMGMIAANVGDYAVIIKGDSMSPIVPNNSVVLVEKVNSINELERGQMVLVRVNGDEAMLKYWDVDMESKAVILKSENRNYSPKFYPLKLWEIGECQVLGKVVEIRITDVQNYYK